MTAQRHLRDSGGPPDEAEFLRQLRTCHDRAREAMVRQDWAALGEVALTLDRVAGDLNRAMAAGFTSQEVDIRLQALIGYLQKALVQTQHLDQVLRQKEDDLRKERQSMVQEASGTPSRSDNAGDEPPGNPD